MRKRYNHLIKCKCHRLLILHPDAADFALVVGGIDGVNRTVFVDGLMTDGILVIGEKLRDEMHRHLLDIVVQEEIMPHIVHHPLQIFCIVNMLIEVDV